MFEPNTLQQATDWVVIQASKAQMAFDDGHFEAAHTCLLDARHAIILAAGFVSEEVAKKVVPIAKDA